MYVGNESEREAWVTALSSEKQNFDPRHESTTKPRTGSLTSVNSLISSNPDENMCNIRPSPKTTSSEFSTLGSIDEGGLGLDISFKDRESLEFESISSFASPKQSVSGFPSPRDCSNDSPPRPDSRRRHTEHEVPIMSENSPKDHNGNRRSTVSGFPSPRDHSDDFSYRPNSRRKHTEFKVPIMFENSPKDHNGNRRNNNLHNIFDSYDDNDPKQFASADSNDNLDASIFVTNESIHIRSRNNSSSSFKSVSTVQSDSKPAFGEIVLEGGIWRYILEEKLTVHNEISKENYLKIIMDIDDIEVIDYRSKDEGLISFSDSMSPEKGDIDVINEFEEDEDFIPSGSLSLACSPPIISVLDIPEIDDKNDQKSPIIKPHNSNKGTYNDNYTSKNRTKYSGGTVDKRDEKNRIFLTPRKFSITLDKSTDKKIQEISDQNITLDDFKGINKDIYINKYTSIYIYRYIYKYVYMHMYLFIYFFIIK
jgi:hypothetical protein